LVCYSAEKIGCHGDLGVKGKSGIRVPADLSLHAGVSAEAHQRDKVERSGGVPRGGPPSLDCIAKLAALVPKPRVNLTRLDEELYWLDGRYRAEIEEMNGGEHRGGT
jgi:hypothetical protein